MKHLQITLTLDQANHILEALSHQPYQQVYELIAHIQQSAQAQYQKSQEEPQEETVVEQNGILAEEVMPS